MRDLLIDYYQHLVDRLEAIQASAYLTDTDIVEIDILSDVTDDIEEILMK